MSRGEPELMFEGLRSPPEPLHAESSNLLDVDPDLTAALGAGAGAARSALKVVLVTLHRGEVELRRVLAGRRAWGAILLDGMISQRVAIGGHSGVELLWPGDILTAFAHVADAQPFLAPEISWSCELDTRIALLPPAITMAAVRWPALGAELRRRREARHVRLATLHAIAQIPRAEERLRLLLWLLAERFGRVTPDGIVLDLRLPYRTIGELIGARRPTLSLAMKALRSNGAVSVREDGALVLVGEP